MIGRFCELSLCRSVDKGVPCAFPLVYRIAVMLLALVQDHSVFTFNSRQWTLIVINYLIFFCGRTTLQIIVHHSRICPRRGRETRKYTSGPGDVVHYRA